MVPSNVCEEGTQVLLVILHHTHDLLHIHVLVNFAHYFGRSTHAVHNLYLGVHALQLHRNTLQLSIHCVHLSS